MIIGAIALGRGIRDHGFMLPSAVGVARARHHGLRDDACTKAGWSRCCTILGVMILALGHKLNMMAADQGF